jgi:ABC-type spermidine/putrescine transport system permease subunit II
MATTTDGETGREPARRYWDLNEDDKRMLLIAFIGTLAANVGLVLTLALGLLVARRVNHYHNGFRNLIEIAYALPLIAAVVGLPLLAAAKRLESWAPINRALICAALVVFVVPLVGDTAIVLAVVGYAAGVK